MSGMISVRNDGKQMPSLIQQFLGKHIYVVYNIFVCMLMLLVGAVFIYTPGDLFVTEILKGNSGFSNPVIWIVYGAIFVYYIIATLFPIDKIIGRVYPIFGAVLILSALGVFAGPFLLKGYPLNEIWSTGVVGIHPKGLHFIPIFFCNRSLRHGIWISFHTSHPYLKDNRQ